MIVAVVIIGVVASLAFTLSITALIRTGNRQGTAFLVLGEDGEGEVGFRNYKNIH